MAMTPPAFVGSYAKKYGIQEDKFMKVCPTCKGTGVALWRKGRRVIQISCPNTLFHKTQEQIDYEDAMEEVNRIAPGLIG